MPVWDWDRSKDPGTTPQGPSSLFWSDKAKQETSAPPAPAPAEPVRPPEPQAAKLEKSLGTLKLELGAEVQAMFLDWEKKMEQRVNSLELSVHREMNKEIEEIRALVTSQAASQAKALEETRNWTLAALGLTSADGEVASYTLKIRCYLDEAQQLVAQAQQQQPTTRAPSKAVPAQGPASGPAVPAAFSPRDNLLLKEELQQAMEKFQAWLHEEVHALHLEMEMACVKAGYLAVAATECEYEEKTQLFSRLQDKEKALKDSSARLALGNVPQMENSLSNYFIVELDRSTGQTLGISSKSDPFALVVKEVSAGLLADWNKGQPEERQVRSGDRIVAINGIRGDSAKLTEAASEHDVLRITFQRGRTSE